PEPPVKTSLTCSLTPVAAPDRPAFIGESPSEIFSIPVWASFPIGPLSPRLSTKSLTLSPRPFRAFSLQTLAEPVKLSFSSSRGRESTKSLHPDCSESWDFLDVSAICVLSALGRLGGLR